MSCPFLLSNNNYNINDTIDIDNNLTNFSNFVTNVLNCAQKIIPEQGEVVVFEKPNFDNTGKVYFYKLNSNNRPGLYNYNYNIEFKSIIIGPYTTFFFRAGLEDKTLPLNDHIESGYEEKNIYFATTNESSEQLPETPNKYYELVDKGTYKSCRVSMANCYTLCDDTSLRTIKGSSCLNSYRQCVTEKKGASQASIISSNIITECSRKFLICQKTGVFPFSNNFNKDYSKMCNPDPTKNNYQPLDDSCYYINKYNKSDGNITNAFQNLFYYGTFFDLCSANECKITCSDSNWQQAWSEKKILEKKIKDKTNEVNLFQNELDILKSDFLSKKNKVDEEMNKIKSITLSNQNEYNDFILNMAKKKEYIVKEIQILLNDAVSSHATNMSELYTKLEKKKNDDIIELNTQFLIREEDYKTNLLDVSYKISNFTLNEKTQRDLMLNDYNNLLDYGEKIIKSSQYITEESLNKNLNDMNARNINEIININNLHKTLLSTAITNAKNEMDKINALIKNETSIFEQFKKDMEEKRKNIQTSFNNTELLYETEINRLNSILTKNNEDNKNTIKKTQKEYENEISNLLKLSDTEKKIILLDKNVTIENKMDFLSGKKDLFSQDFENKKKLINAEYELAINAQENLYENQIYKLKQENDNIINGLINITNNYRNTISETQQNLETLEKNQKNRREELDNKIKNIKEEGEEKLRLIISEHEDNKIKLLKESENKTLLMIQEINDKITEKQNIALQARDYYELKIEKILSESKDKRIELIKNNTKELEVSISNLEKEYKNKSKELDIKIEKLTKERNILQEESNSKLNNLNIIITEEKEYKNVYIKSQYKTFSLGILIIINIILLILKLKK